MGALSSVYLSDDDVLILILVSQEWMFPGLAHVRSGQINLALV